MGYHFTIKRNELLTHITMWIFKWTFTILYWIKEARKFPTLFIWNSATGRTNLWLQKPDQWLTLQWGVEGLTENGCIYLDLGGGYTWRHMLCCCAQSLSHVWLCDPTDCSPPGSSVHGIVQARILDWAAISDFKGSSQPRDQIWISCLLHWQVDSLALNHLRCT